MSAEAKVLGVHVDANHRFSKRTVKEIQLLAGLGVFGDAHLGVTVQHLSRVRADPTAPNLRQVHLIHQELFGSLLPKGFAIVPGALGENITTTGIDLLGLPRGTLLRIGQSAVVEVTGLRNPCAQINNFRPGLLKELVGHDSTGVLVRKAGIMGIIRHGGIVKNGDQITMTLPPTPHEKLDRV